MEAYREIIDGRKLVDIINIPKKFIDLMVEIIILPVEKKGEGKGKIKIAQKVKMNSSKNTLPKAFYNPVKVDRYLNVNREEIYENV